MALALAPPGPLASLAAAQDKPDFSGHWVLANPRKPNESVARELTVWRTSNEPDAPSGYCMLNGDSETHGTSKAKGF